MQLLQIFGKYPDQIDHFLPGETISAIAWDKTGEVLAGADLSGRVVIFQQASTDSELKYQIQGYFLSECTILSVYPEALTSLAWMSFMGSSNQNLLLAAHEHAIHLWRVPSDAPSEDFKIPVKFKRRYTRREGRAFPPIHTIHGNMDGVSFLSAHPQAILWHRLDSSDEATVELVSKALTETAISSAVFHPCQESILGYGDRAGRAYLIDTRRSRNMNAATINIGTEPTPLYVSASSVVFSPNASLPLMLVRDGFTERIYDLRRPDRTLEISPMTPELHDRMLKCYEQDLDLARDLIHYPFPCGFTSDCRYTVTGSFYATLASSRRDSKHLRGLVDCPSPTPLRTRPHECDMKRRYVSLLDPAYRTSQHHACDPSANNISTPCMDSIDPSSSSSYSSCGQSITITSSSSSSHSSISESGNGSSTTNMNPSVVCGYSNVYASKHHQQQMGYENTPCSNDAQCIRNSNDPEGITIGKGPYFARSDLCPHIPLTHPIRTLSVHPRHPAVAMSLGPTLFIFDLMDSENDSESSAGLGSGNGRSMLSPATCHTPAFGGADPCASNSPSRFTLQ